MRNLEQIKADLVADLNHEFPGIGPKADELLSKMMQTYSNESENTIIKILELTAEKMTEKLSKKNTKSSENITSAPENEPVMKKLNKTYPDGSYVSINYMVKQKNGSETVVYDGSVGMMDTNKLLKKDWYKNIKNKFQSESLNITMMEQELKNVCIVGRILENTEPGSKEHNILSKQYTSVKEKFQKDFGDIIDTSQLPGK